MPYHDGNLPQAKYYIESPPNVPVYELKRPWMFKTKDEAGSFAGWLDEVLLMCEYRVAAERLAPYDKTPMDAIEAYVKDLDALEEERRIESREA